MLYCLVQVYDMQAGNARGAVYQGSSARGEVLLVLSVVICM